MDKSGFRLNHFWNNRDSMKSTNNQQKSVNFFDGSSDLIQSRFFTILVVTLLFIVSLNLILSFWIIHSLQIGNGGLGEGNLQTTVKRMTIKGQAKFNGWLTAEEINPVHRDQWLSIVGLNDHIQLVDYDQGESNDLESNGLTMNNNGINYQGSSLIVNKLTNGSKEIQFSLNSNQLTTNTLKELKITDWGLVVDERLETTSIKGDHYHDLRLESRMKGLTMEALTSNINVKSKVGPVKMNSLKDVTLSANRLIRIDSSRIHFNSLIKSKSVRHHHHHHHNQPQFLDTNGTINRKESIGYQLCICENGKLFLTHGDKACYLSPEICSTPIEGKIN